MFVHYTPQMANWIMILATTSNTIFCHVSQTIHIYTVWQGA